MSIKYRAGYKYQLAETYIHQLPFAVPPAAPPHEYLAVTFDHRLIIRAGYAWDGASGPSIDTANSMRASLVHDALYQLMRDGYLDREMYKGAADRELQRVLVQDGMSRMRAWYWYQAVRLFGRRGTMPDSNPVLVAP